MTRELLCLFLKNWICGLDASAAMYVHVSALKLGAGSCLFHVQQDFSSVKAVLSSVLMQNVCDAQFQDPESTLW